MPAVPQEKATAVSLSENNFSELKYKELASSANALTVAMATTATASNNARLHQQNAHHHQHRNTCGCGAASATVRSESPTLTTTATPSSIAATTSLYNGSCSADVVDGLPSRQHQNNNNNNNHIGLSISNSYLVNGHTSPLAAAVASQNGSPTAQHITPSSSAYIYNCCNRQTAIAGNTSMYSYSSSSSSNSSSKSTSSLLSATTAPAAPRTPPKKSAKDFIFGKYIGEGSFSSVYLAVDVLSHSEYAIKVCDKRHIQREKKQEYVLREREVMHMLTNVPGFVNLSCTFQDARSLYFVMTYAKKGDLLPYINKVGSFDVQCTRHYAAELVLACEEMHQRNIVHRDLKPENILLDEDMHTLIADFGSSKIFTPEQRAEALETLNRAAAAAKAGMDSGSTNGLFGIKRKSRSQTRNSQGVTTASLDSNEDDEEDEGCINEDDEDEDTTTGSDDNSPSRNGETNGAVPRRYCRKRNGSFVGTAQYVSPEVLQNGPITPAADLWALGCIVYQMISGLPPFRSSNEYFIFREILACKLDFPEGFDKDAADLVRQLLKLNPAERLGALDNDEHGRYVSIRQHPFFKSIDFDRVRFQTPPPIYPYLPGVSDDEDFSTKYRHLEPGLDDKQLTRLLVLNLGTSIEMDVIDGAADEVDSPLEKTISSSPNSTSSAPSSPLVKKTAVIAGNAGKNIFALTPAEKQKRLELQKTDKWHPFADNEVILRKGYVNKRKGLFARKRMLLLTTGPRLIYIDPVQMIKKGEIPWSAELRVEPRNFKIFFVHTPTRTYYLEDPEGFSLEWGEAIEKMHLLTYKNPQTKTHQTESSSSSINKTSNNTLSVMPVRTTSSN